MVFLQTRELPKAKGTLVKPGSLDIYGCRKGAYSKSFGENWESDAIATYRSSKSDPAAPGTSGLLLATVMASLAFEWRPNDGMPCGGL